MKPLPKILTLFGTRPEVIKLAPIIRELENFGERLSTVNVTSAQHKDLLYPFTSFFNIRIDYDLNLMRPDQTPNELCSRVLSALDKILHHENPTLLLVQGDTSTATAGALAGFYCNVPVAHVEAGLRSGDPRNPYPEEMNRTLITKLATLHFAATAENRHNLLAEGVKDSAIFVTGNPVVESVTRIARVAKASADLAELLTRTRDLKRLVLTTHRRESFGPTLAANLQAIRGFVDRHPDVALIFPVHPNPSVCKPARKLLLGHSRIHLIAPLGYEDFIVLLSKAWLIVSDSGGLQEEAPTLGKPLLVMRENTERPEGLESGVTRLVGGSSERLVSMLEDAYQNDFWASVTKIDNPFGHFDSGKQIARTILNLIDPDQAGPVSLTNSHIASITPKNAQASNPNLSPQSR